MSEFSLRCAWLLLAGLAAGNAVADSGSRLLATGGVTQVEGSAGGGLTPWALIAGYGSNEQVHGTAYFTKVTPKDFDLESVGAAVGIYNRLELSFARQHFGLGSTVPGQTIDQQIVGAKLRLLGDAVFDADTWLPQLAIGLQYKRNLDFDLVPQALGAKHASGSDIYLNATKVYLAGLCGYNTLLNATLRFTKANQFGLLGFGGDLNDRYQPQFEASAGVFLNRHWLLGGEFRQKPNNLSAFEEQSAKDLFIAYLPNKSLAFTAAYADLGRIADKTAQRGAYLSAQFSY